MELSSQRLFRRAALTVLACTLIPGCFRDCNRDYEEDATAAPVCVDYDGDGYGDLYPGEAVSMNYPRARVACLQALDCNDQDPDHWNDCDTCQDKDGDGWFAKCNSYTGIQGPDCDDNDPDNWLSCATCRDADGDSWFTGCDAYTTRNGPDCSDSDPDNWLSCATCRDADGDSSFVGCDAYAIRNGVDCDDGDSLTYPGAEEICDGLDNDCDGNSDGGVEVYGKIRQDIRISWSGYSDISSTLVWTGSEFGVSWCNNMNYGSCLMARLSPEGVKIGSDITLVSSDSMKSSITWTGSEFGAVWTRDPYPAEIVFKRLASDGSAIGAPITLDYIRDGYFSPSILWTGSMFGVTWNAMDFMPPRSYSFFNVIEIFDPTWVLPSSKSTAGSTDGMPLTLAWTGSEFGASWMYDRVLHFVRIGTDASPILPELLIYGNNYFPARPSLVWSGSEFAVAWTGLSTSELDFSRISPNGSKIGSDVQVLKGFYSSLGPSLVWTGSEYGIAWCYGTTNSKIYFARLGADGTKIGSNLVVASNTGNIAIPSLSWTGSEFGVSWEDNRDGNYEIYFTRLGLTCP